MYRNYYGRIWAHIISTYTLIITPIRFELD
jgi:hypothetical protein